MAGHRQWMRDNIRAADLRAAREIKGIPVKSTARFVLAPNAEPGEADHGSGGNDAVNASARKDTECHPQ